MPKEEITSYFPGDPRRNAVSIIYQRYAQGMGGPCRDVPVDVLVGGMAVSFALDVLDHPEELAEAQREAEEIERERPKKR